MIGIRTIQEVAADIPVASSVVPVVVLSTPVPAGSAASPTKMKLKFWVPFSVGATGGIRALWSALAGVTVIKNTLRLNNTVAPAQTIALQTALNTAFTNALANAGNHWIEGELIIHNTGAAGVMSLNMAQNTSDALTLTIFQGGTMEVTQF